MGLFDLFKGSKVEALETEIERLNKLITPDAQMVGSLKQELSELKTQKDTLANEITNIKENLAILSNDAENYKKAIELRKSQIVEMDEKIYIQNCGLYKPQYDFADALGYKEKLEEIRLLQKNLIKSNMAVTGTTDWLVNNSKIQGRKMVKDTQTLLLRAFNSECDSLISKVKYSNFDTYLKRITKASETISKLGAIFSISITPDYIDLKIQELHLAFEYQQKKQQEKEELRAAKATQREALKLQKEIEAERKKIEKEQNHYETALQNIIKSLRADPENPELVKKKAELETHLSEIEHSLNDIDYREANQKAGYVYIISNIGAFGENIYKIGMTRRLDPQERIDELGGASVPFRFDIHAMIFSDDAPALEAALHRAFDNKKLNMINSRKEFFNVSLDEIKEVVKNNFDKTVEFIDVPDAEQYRMSQLMRKELN